MKKVISIFIVLVLLLCSTTPVVFANDVTVENSHTGSAKITLTDNKNNTEEIFYVEPQIVVSKLQKRSNNEDGSTSYAATCTVFIPLNVNANGGLTRGETIGGQANDGVRGMMTVYYDYIPSDNLLRTNAVEGSWTMNSTYYYLGNREVGLHSGTGNGYLLEEHPTTNSYEYITGWGYVNRYWDTLSARAWSEADIYISGMSGTSGHITVDFAFPNE